MPKNIDPTVERFFVAVQAGAASEEAMMALFHPDAVYSEPFSGTPRIHRGKSAIRAALSEGWRHPLPQMRIAVDRVDIDGNTVRAEWTCYSPALPGGSGRGVNRFVLSQGLIAELETQLIARVP